MITITYDGITDTITGWANRTKIPVTTIRSRFEYGWTLDRILTQPVRKHRSTERRQDMSDDTEADIVLQLDALATYAERANHWTDDKRLMDATGVADTVFGAIHRIEELEAKLAKAVEALQWFIDNDDTNEGDEPMPEFDGMTWNELNAYWIEGLKNGRATLAELKGQNDE
jgi:hypothetical protein